MKEIGSPITLKPKNLVEPDGIEPLTSPPHYQGNGFTVRRREQAPLFKYFQSTHKIYFENMHTRRMPVY